MYNPRAHENLPGVTNARQIHIAHVGGRVIYEWICGDNKWHIDENGVISEYVKGTGSIPQQEMKSSPPVNKSSPSGQIESDEKGWL
jgi:hypothetical protein